VRVVGEEGVGVHVEILRDLRVRGRGEEFERGKRVAAGGLVEIVEARFKGLAGRGCHGKVEGGRGKVKGERWKVGKLFDAFDNEFGVNGFAEVVLDVIAEGRGCVPAVFAGAGEAEKDGLAIEADEFKVAAVGLEKPAKFVEFGLDEFLHGESL